jgi:hypothetical protein
MYHRGRRQPHFKEIAEFFLSSLASNGGLLMLHLLVLFERINADRLTRTRPIFVQLKFHNHQHAPFELAEL